MDDLNGLCELLQFCNLCGRFIRWKGDDDDASAKGRDSISHLAADQHNGKFVARINCIRRQPFAWIPQLVAQIFGSRVQYWKGC